MRARLAAGLAFAAALVVTTGAAHAQDTFEIQVYDAALTPVGHLETDWHLNTTPITAAVPGYSATADALHATLESVYGVSREWEVGFYLLSAWSDVGPIFAGAHVRARVRTPPDWWFPIAFSLNCELARDASAYAEGTPWSLEVRPIADYRGHGIIAVFNPIIDFGLAGPGRSAVPDFEPCAHLAVPIGARGDVGVEYYTGLGPLFAISPLDRERHYLFATSDLAIDRHLSLNLGVGHGFTRASSALVTKAIVEIVY